MEICWYKMFPTIEKLDSIIITFIFLLLAHWKVNTKLTSTHLS